MKIGIVGVGSVGGAIASCIVMDGIARELAIIDVDKKRLNAAALDLGHAATFGRGTKIISGGYGAIAGADIVIISAGANQKIGQSRTELVEQNAAVMIDVVPKIMSVADSARVILIVVSNPLDAMATAVQKLSGLPAARVIGTGTMLDSARVRYELARRLDVSPQSVDAYVSGEHGDTSVINWDSISIDGIPLAEFSARKTITAKTRADIERQVRGAAMEIIKGRGATWDGIAAATLDLVRCIDRDERRILPVSIVDAKSRVAYSIPRIVGCDGVIASFPQADISESIRAIKKTYEIIE